MEPGTVIVKSSVTKRIRAAAFIMALAMVFSCLLFHFEDDINYAVSGMAAPPLKKLTYSPTKTGYKAVLTWQAKKGRDYQVMRKTSSTGKYKVLAVVKATSSTGKYTDKSIGKNKTFTYTVRRVILSGKKVKDTGKYDGEGLTTIKMPALTVNFTNLKADVSWKKVSGATQYLINRRVGKSDKFYNIRKFASKLASGEKEYSYSSGTKQFTYSDYYYYSTNKDKSKAYSKKLAEIISLRLRGNYLDASNNPLSYRVQGYYSKKVNLVKKESYGLYLPDGEFRLEAPSIVSISDGGVMKWGHVANAEGYRIYSSPDGNDWTKVTDVKSTGYDYIPVSEPALSEVYQEYQLPDFDSGLYYTVRAFASKNGKTLYSSYDTGFTIKNRKYSENILCVGDSISFGSPYYEEERKNFTYQNRISQLTGVKFFNPSIPGATYHHGGKDSAEAEEVTDDSTSKLVTGVVQMVVKGENTDKMLTTYAGRNDQTLDDFDIVVLAGGTNDYLHYDSGITSWDKLRGNPETDWTKIKDSDKTKNLKFTVNADVPNYARTYTESYDYNIKTFDGAYNQIMKWIEEASVLRVQHGKKPIKVISLSMFYSDRTKRPYYVKTNRDTTKNSIGATLKDYQKELNNLNSIWNNSAALDVYAYDTRGAYRLSTDSNKKEYLLNNSEACQYRTADNLHLTKYTYSQYGNSLGTFMIDNCFGDNYVNASSADFIALAARHGLLSERLAYLEEEAAQSSGMLNSSPEEVLGMRSDGSSLALQSEEEPEEEYIDPAVEEMIDYIRQLARYGYLEQMLDECSPEDRARYESFIEFYNIFGEEPAEEPSADDNEDAEASYEDSDTEDANTDAADIAADADDIDSSEDKDDASDVNDQLIPDNNNEAVMPDEDSEPVGHDE